VELLATRPRPELLAALRGCVAAERDALAANDLIEAVSASNEFRRHMVEFAENRALSLFAGILEGIPSNVYQEFLQGADTPTRRAFQRRTVQSVAAHAKLVELIVAGKPAKARAFWRTYNEATAAFLERTGLAELRVKMPVSLR
jgi:DNA-binding GntR family transcriptional regulator